MINRIVSAVMLLAVLLISIGFGISKLPYPEAKELVYRDSFNYSTTSSDYFVVEGEIIEPSSSIESMETVIEEIVVEEPKITEPVVKRVNTSAVEYDSFFDAEDWEEDTEKEVYVSIIGIDDTLAKGTIQFEPGDSVFDVTKKLAEDEGVEFKRRGAGDTVYIYKIGDLSERDYGPMSGWVYTVNGDRVNVGCGSYKIEEGDSIEWQYKTD